MFLLNFSAKIFKNHNIGPWQRGQVVLSPHAIGEIGAKGRGIESRRGIGSVYTKPEFVSCDMILVLYDAQFSCTTQLWSYDTKFVFRVNTPIGW
jgi:hypothetical protein